MVLKSFQLLIIFIFYHFLEKFLQILQLKKFNVIWEQQLYGGALSVFFQGLQSFLSIISAKILVAFEIFKS